MKRRNFKDLNGPNLLLMIHEGQNGRNIMPVIAQYDEFVSYESFYLEFKRNVSNETRYQIASYESWK